jgi:TPR repeat protein
MTKASWYRVAAAQENASTQYNLGVMNAHGDGVVQDDVIAHIWINISGANGHSRVSDGRGLVEEGMTREQIAEAQALARSCMASDY